MTPAEEARFIQLWQEGLTCPDIAERLDIPPGTARSRAYSLQQQGKIRRRPQGGRRVPARPEGTPATPAPQVPPTPPTTPAPPVAPAMTFVAVPEIQDMLSLMQDLHARVIALEQTRVPPALPAPPATPHHPHPPRPNGRTSSSGPCGFPRP